jgi:hypothetical protein
MPNDAIFLVSDSGELRRVEHQLYSSEDVLQQLIARYPEVLAGDQIDSAAPPRWLLVRREASIPATATGEGRWWLDHLLLDQFGIPTLVEVKRSTDTRIRREVIGQMLDYVANAQAYWPADRMREMLTKEYGSIEAGAVRLAEFLELPDDAEDLVEEINRFWQRVETNLRKGDVRLLFVADELPPELRRLIEFLNEQFTNIEVLGVELRQYVGQGIKALVPRVVGQTQAAVDLKERSSPVRSARTVSATDRAGFLASVGQDAAEFFAELLDEEAKAGRQISFGSKGLSIRVPNEPAFLYCYPAGANGRRTPELELFLRDIGDSDAIEQVRARFKGVSHIYDSGKFTLRMPVTRATMAEAKEVQKIASEIMEQQRSGEATIGGRGSARTVTS